MKYIVIGLGEFGLKCASALTRMGHEVLGIDNSGELLEELEESFTSVIRMDTTNINAVKTLPLHDVDAIIVAIGEDVGASVLTLSILKNLKAGRIIGRAINEIHHNILTQIGIDEVVLPLEDSAFQLASMLQLRGVNKFTELCKEYAIAEVNVPPDFISHLPSSVNLEERMHIKLVAIKRPPKEGILSSVFKREYKTDLFFSDETAFAAGDILVIAGKVSDIKKFIG